MPPEEEGKLRDLVRELTTMPPDGPPITAQQLRSIAAKYDREDTASILHLVADALDAALRERDRLKVMVESEEMLLRLEAAEARVRQVEGALRAVREELEHIVARIGWINDA